MQYNLKPVESIIVLGTGRDTAEGDTITQIQAMNEFMQTHPAGYSGESIAAAASIATVGVRVANNLPEEDRGEALYGQGGRFDEMTDLVSSDGQHIAWIDGEANGFYIAETWAYPNFEDDMFIEELKGGYKGPSREWLTRDYAVWDAAYYRKKHEMEDVRIYIAGEYGDLFFVEITDEG